MGRVLKCCVPGCTDTESPQLDLPGIRAVHSTNPLRAVSVTRPGRSTAKTDYLYKMAAKLKHQTRILSFGKRLRMAEDPCNMECFKELAARVDDVYQFIMSQELFLKARSKSQMIVEGRSFHSSVLL